MIGYEDSRPTRRAVSVFRRKRKRFAVSKEQNIAVYGMYDPPITDPLYKFTEIKNQEVNQKE